MSALFFWHNPWFILRITQKIQDYETIFTINSPCFGTRIL